MKELNRAEKKHPNDVLTDEIVSAKLAEMESRKKSENEDLFVENLRAAILQQAVKDYLRYLSYGNKEYIRAMEKWFLSPYGQLISGDQGQEIINTALKLHRERKEAWRWYQRKYEKKYAPNKKPAE